jgi:hypothetical protein
VEPVSLQCPKCGAAWTVFKADGPIACPNCKAPVELPAAAAPTAPEPIAPPPTAPPTPSPPTVVESAPTPVPVASRPAPRRPEAGRPDHDDQALRRDYDEAGGPRFPPRRRRHPLLVVLLVLLILFILLPVAAFAVLFAVCAFSGR